MLQNYQNAPVVISARGHSRKQLAMPITAAIDITRAEMARSEIYINENVAIPHYHDVQALLQERNSLHSAGERSVKVCRYDWLTTIGAGSSFSERVYAPPRQSAAASPLAPAQRAVASSCEKRKATEDASQRRIDKLFIVGKKESGFSNCGAGSTPTPARPRSLSPPLRQPGTAETPAPVHMSLLATDAVGAGSEVNDVRHYETCVRHSHSVGQREGSRRFQGSRHRQDRG